MSFPILQHAIDALDSGRIEIEEFMRTVEEHVISSNQLGQGRDQGNTPEK
jgi:hypothetical protein